MRTMSESGDADPPTSAQRLFALLVEKQDELFGPRKGFLAHVRPRGHLAIGGRPLGELGERQRIWTIGLVTTGLLSDEETDLFALLASEPRGAADDAQSRLALYELMVELSRAQAASTLILSRARGVVSSADDASLRPLADQIPHVFTPSVRFRNLSAFESAWLDRAEHQTTARVRGPGTTREPWVERPARDYFGVALSGGGIRSATFNLGLLQALADQGLLAHVDYVSTVSGGGYVGGFWTALRHHSDDGPSFPGTERAGDHDRREHPSIRHLREFSRFLVPRVGFTQSETWNAVVAVLCGTAASLLATLALLACVFYAWWFGVRELVRLDSLWGAFTFALATLLFHLACERRISSLGKLGELGKAAQTRWWGWALSLVASALAFLAWSFLALQHDSWLCAAPEPTAEQPPWCAFGALAASTSTTRQGYVPAPSFGWYMLAPTTAWLAVAIFLMFARGFMARFLPRDAHGIGLGTAVDRTMGRFLASSIALGAVALVWWAATEIDAVFGAAGTAGSVGIFVWLRDWLKAPVERTHGSALLERAGALLKRCLPQLAAAAAVILACIGVAMLLQHLGLGAHPDPIHARIGFATAVLVLAVALVFFDPARIGLHDFYRARVARCFLGAARAGVEGELGPRAHAATTEQPDDDIALGDLRKKRKPGAPLHLVCCAANNLSGDVLGSLYRGARSTVVSPFGVSIGNVSAPADHVRLSSVLTASAAAFNSQMGALSMRLGPSVAFLMCALNLRIGLWMPHPLNPRRHTGLFSGFYFFLEAFGVSRADQVASESFRRGGLISFFDRSMSHLHLSDGGHFENLALYELVRRHCRYIIVSDATADSNLLFDDLGNATRRVREDFGVEIELDVSALRRNGEGWSVQHAVVGTIHYDGPNGNDKGFLIYFKPTLTGDEPADIAEYRARNSAFPHDTTADQFYDEAQWESYRRLGQHAAAVVLRFSKQQLGGDPVDRLFMLAGQRWHATQRDRGELFLGFSERAIALDGEVRDQGPAFLRSELFPEVGAALATTPAQPEPEGVMSALFLLMSAVQLMEDVWLAARLDDTWAHPLNEGWMNYFQRWASTPSFRTWWPVLRPLYSPLFRDFVKERFGLGMRTSGYVPGEAGITLSEARSGELTGLAAADWRRRNLQAFAKDRSALAALLHLADPMLRPLEVGILFYQLEAGSRCVEWNSSDFFVPPSLLGAGVIARFLDAIIEKFEGYDLRVHLDDGLVDADAPAQAGLRPDRKRTRGAGQRAAVAQTIAFYKSRGFQYEDAAEGGRPQVLRLRRAARQ